MRSDSSRTGLIKRKEDIAMKIVLLIGAIIIVGALETFADYKFVSGLKDLINSKKKE